MSASIATAMRATVSGEVAEPAVFQVITRMPASVLAGRVSVPTPRPTTTAMLTTIASAAIAATDRATARSGRAIASSRAMTASAAKAIASGPRKEMIWAIGKVRSRRKKPGHVSTAAATAQITVARTPSRRSTSKL